MKITCKKETDGIRYIFQDGKNPNRESIVEIYCKTDTPKEMAEVASVLEYVAKSIKEIRLTNLENLKQRFEQAAYKQNTVASRVRHLFPAEVNTVLSGGESPILKIKDNRLFFRQFKCFSEECPHNNHPDEWWVEVC